MGKISRGKLWGVAITVVLLAALWLCRTQVLLLVAQAPFLPKGLRMVAYNWYGNLEAAKHNKKMDFYARIVDQNGDAVVGAQVLMQYTANLPGKAAVDLHLTTDSQGAFSLHETGVHYRLTSIHGEGYLFSSAAHTEGVWYYDESPPLLTTDPQNPLVFTMWKIIGQPEMLRDLTVDRLSGHTFDPPASIYLGSVSERGHIDAGKKPDADLWVTCQQGPAIPTRFAGKTIHDTTLIVEAPHGGVIKFDTPYPYMAPEGGYQREYTFAVKASELPANQDTYLLRLYVKAANGQKYAAIEINNGGYYISGVLNPTGSRNLQPGGGFFNH